MVSPVNTTSAGAARGAAPRVKPDPAPARLPAAAKRAPAAEDKVRLARESVFAEGLAARQIAEASDGDAQEAGALAAAGRLRPSPASEGNFDRAMREATDGDGAESVPRRTRRLSQPTDAESATTSTEERSGDDKSFDAGAHLAALRGRHGADAAAASNAAESTRKATAAGSIRAGSKAPAFEIPRRPNLKSAELSTMMAQREEARMVELFMQEEMKKDEEHVLALMKLQMEASAAALKAIQEIGAASIRAAAAS